MVNMDEKNEQLLRIEIQTESMYLPINHIEEIIEIEYIKLLPCMKKNVIGLTLIKNSVLPVISFDENFNLPTVGIVLKNNRRKYFLQVSSVKNISNMNIGNFEKTEHNYILRSGENKIIDTEKISRILF
jgi:chemotaxis signal transduction protein